jgi:helix-turn-helix protein
MLTEKDLATMSLITVQGLKEQLMMQETQILTLVRPGELSLPNQIGMKKARLDEIAQDLIAEIDAFFLT